MGTPGRANSSSSILEGLFINEIMASNSNTISDEHGEYDDWIEIFNRNDFAVNIGGLYITDNLSNPNKWELPLNYPELTTIGAKGYLLVWADDQPGQGPLHASYKLSASGEELGIFQRIPNDYHRIDGVVFGAQNNTQSLGRYPDGDSDPVLMLPSPGFPNWRTGTDQLQDSKVKVYPNPFNRFATFKTEGISKPFDLLIRNLAGSLVFQSLNNSENEVIVFREAFVPGIYVYQVRSAEGQMFSGKLVVY
jgi:hypothetical protein